MARPLLRAINLEAIPKAPLKTFDRCSKVAACRAYSLIRNSFLFLIPLVMGEKLWIVDIVHGLKPWVSARLPCIRLNMRRHILPGT